MVNKLILNKHEWNNCSINFYYHRTLERFLRHFVHMKFSLPFQIFQQHLIISAIYGNTEYELLTKTNARNEISEVEN